MVCVQCYLCFLVVSEKTIQPVYFPVKAVFLQVTNYYKISTKVN